MVWLQKISKVILGFSSKILDYRNQKLRKRQGHMSRDHETLHNGVTFGLVHSLMRWFVAFLKIKL